VVSAALLDALDRLRGTGPEFNSFLANHGPMAAEAMVQLHAADHVPGWVDWYRTRLTPEPEVRGRLRADEWRHHLGDVRFVGDWSALFERRIIEIGWQQTILEWWPRLLPGLSASATHGVIRTAHAVRSLRALRPSESDEQAVLAAELARGLALWASRYQLLPGWPGLNGRHEAVDAVAGLPRLNPDEPSVGPGVGGRLGAVVRLRGFPDALDHWGAPADTDAALTSIVSAAARVLAARDDAPIAFCHTVTAPAALRLVLPELPTELHRPTVAAGWQVVAGVISAYAAPGLATERDHVEVDPAPLLAELGPKAVEHGDEHVIKLAEAALREYAISGDTTLLVAADRFRGRLEPIDLG
jgi:hypothetical protein